MKVAENRSYIKTTLPTGYYDNEVKDREDPITVEPFSLPSTFIIDDENKKTVEMVNPTVVEEDLADSLEHYKDANPQEWEIAEEKTEELDIPAVGGFEDDYWEVDIGDKILKIQKPKAPLADLKEMTKDVDVKSFEKEEEIKSLMSRSFRVEEEEE